MNRLNIYIVLVSCISLMLIGCKKEAVTGSEYLAYIYDMDNDLQKVNSIEPFELTAQYMPARAMAYQEYINSEQSTNLDSLISKYGAMQYIKLRIASDDENTEVLRNNCTGLDEYHERISYVQFDMQSDFSMITNDDTLACKLYHYERSYGLTPYDNVVLAFPGEGVENTDRTLVFDDKIFRMGRVKFNFKQSALNNIPELKTEI